MWFHRRVLIHLHVKSLCAASKPFALTALWRVFMINKNNYCSNILFMKESQHSKHLNCCRLYMVEQTLCNLAVEVPTLIFHQASLTPAPITFHQVFHCRNHYSPVLYISQLPYKNCKLSFTLSFTMCTWISFFSWLIPLLQRLVLSRSISSNAKESGNRFWCACAGFECFCPPKVNDQLQQKTPVCDIVR